MSDDDFDGDYNDFDDDDTTDFPQTKNKGTGTTLFSGDNSGSQIPSKVDLNAFLRQLAVSTPSISSQSIHAKGDDDAEEDVAEDEPVEEEGEEDEEYATEEEEEDEWADISIPSGPVESPSQIQLRLEMEHRRRMAKREKRALIAEYLSSMKHLNNTRTRNALLRLKITSIINERDKIIERYIKLEKDEIEKAKETDLLNKMHNIESQNAMSRRRKKKKGESVPDLTDEITERQTRFLEPSSLSRVESEEEVLPAKTPLLVKDLRKGYLYTTRHAVQGMATPEETTECKRKTRMKRPSKDPVKFSLMRSMMLEDDTTPKGSKPEMSRRTRLLNIRLSRRMTTRYSASSLKSFSAPSRQTLLVKRHLRLIRDRRSKSRTDLTKDERRQKKPSFKVEFEEDSKTPPKATDIDLKGLNQFKYELAEQQLSTPNALKMREDLMNMLQHRHIPVDKFVWPMQVKGIGFDSTNPYGRVRLNYTRLENHEKDHHHSAYRVILTNLAFLRINEQRMLQTNLTNMIELEETRNLLSLESQQFLVEVCDTLQIWAEQAGITFREKYDSKLEMEKFTSYLQGMYHTLLEIYVELYRKILATELAIRKLSYSEGKGVGAELNEFNYIMRCNEKLKAEHNSIQEFILRYQDRSKGVLENIRTTNKKANSIMAEMDDKTRQNEKLKDQVHFVAEGLHFCQDLYRQKEREERALRKEMGILPSPTIFKDYQKMGFDEHDIKVKRIRMRLHYNGMVREIYKISPKCLNAQLQKHQRVDYSDC